MAGETPLKASALTFSTATSLTLVAEALMSVATSCSGFRIWARIPPSIAQLGLPGVAVSPGPDPFHTTTTGRQDEARLIGTAGGGFLATWHDGTGDSFGLIKGQVFGFYSSFLAPHNASLAYAITFVLLCMAIMYPLYRKRIYIKV